ncbi:hypothetical protein K440DRAFT_627872 [Wilcoxina mikolae CBS 423.85]|nr:hypothetical protein K440DRAFT_627872 [Wilcoxina mikolae CBS 423.85]
MVNPTASSSSPTSPAINQHSGLTSQANEEGCNDDPPPIPQPPVGGNGHASGIQAGGFHLPDNHQPDNLTARPQATREPNSTGELAPGSGVYSIRVRDYGASPSSSGDDLHVATSSSYEIGSETAATSDAASSNSSTIAVDASYGGTVIDVSLDGYDGKNPHTVEASAVAAVLGVTLASGLKTADAKQKLHQEGPNKLTGDEGITWYGVLLRQVSNSLTLVGDPVALFTTILSIVFAGIHCQSLPISLSMGRRC